VATSDERDEGRTQRWRNLSIRRSSVGASARRASKDLSGGEVADAIQQSLGASFDWPMLRSSEVGQALPLPAAAEALAQFYGRPLAELLRPETEAERAARNTPEPGPTPPDHRSAALRERSPYRPRPTASDRTSSWHLLPGDTIRRVELHERYGGGRQGGISPSRQTPNVLVFSDPAVGTEHGYLDRWESDDAFLYCGEGQSGDQEFIRGNAAILHHQREHRALRVFEGCSGIVRYAGEFELAHPKGYEIERSHATGTTALRNVIMFRLVPVRSGTSQGRRTPDA
jgi:hypothetical protein